MSHLQNNNNANNNPGQSNNNDNNGRTEQPSLPSTGSSSTLLAEEARQMIANQSFIPVIPTTTTLTSNTATLAELGSSLPPVVPRSPSYYTSVTSVTNENMFYSKVEKQKQMIENYLRSHLNQFQKPSSSKDSALPAISSGTQKIFLMGPKSPAIPPSFDFAKLNIRDRPTIARSYSCIDLTKMDSSEIQVCAASEPTVVRRQAKRKLFPAPADPLKAQHSEAVRAGLKRKLDDKVRFQSAEIQFLYSTQSNPSDLDNDEIQKVKRYSKRYENMKYRSDSAPTAVEQQRQIQVSNPSPPAKIVLPRNRIMISDYTADKGPVRAWHIDPGKEVQVVLETKEDISKRLYF